MRGKIMRGNDRKDRRANERYGGFPLLSAALALLVCVTIFSVPVVQGRDLVVRQEAPFPPIFDASASEPVRYEVLRGDFHMHTLHSDGTVPPVDRVIEAWQYGYDAIAITDHGSFRAYEEARSMADTLGLVFIRGMETGLSGKEHLVALDFGADYEPRNPHQWAETQGQSQVFYRDQWQRLSAAGAFVLYAHPHVGLREPVLWGIGQGLLQGIEVKNDVVGSGWNTVASHGTYWYPSAFDWAVEHGLTIFANSDVHGARGDAPQAITLVLVRDRSVAGVMEALYAGRTVAYFNNMLCGHEGVLNLLMANLVEVGLLDAGQDGTFLRLHNRGPLEMTAEFPGMPLDPVALGASQKALVGLRRTPNTVTITWRNLYLRPTQNLTTTHIFAGSAP